MNMFRAYWLRYRAWARINAARELKEMPTPYLFTQFGLATFVSTMLPTILVPSTRLFLEALDKPMPWWGGLIGLWLAGWWLLQVGALLVVLSHGRALGDRLFNTPKPPLPSP
jgi:hypothetical protein